MTLPGSLELDCIRHDTDVKITECMSSVHVNTSLDMAILRSDKELGRDEKEPSLA